MNLLTLATLIGALMANATDMLPPQNLEAEQGVIGGLIRNPSHLHDVAAVLRPEDFYRDDHQTIYRALLGMYDRGVAVDCLLLSEELNRLGQLDRIGGDQRLFDIFDSVPHAANTPYFAGIVREKSITRTVIQAAEETIRDGYSQQYTSEELVERNERRVHAISEGAVTGNDVAIRDSAAAVMERFTNRLAGEVPGISTGLTGLDEMLDGLMPGKLYVIAARPSIGKTSLALNICDHVSITMRHPSLFVSLEMTAEELTERLIAGRARINSYAFKGRMELGQDQMDAIGAAYDEVAAAPIVIDESSTRNPTQIMANARRHKARRGMSVLVVDYLQLIELDDSRGDSRQEQVSKISRRMKALAKELRIPVILLSQLNRLAESRQDRKPRMADLRESGAIEQDADVVILIHRPEFYDFDDRPGEADLIVEKNRGGRTDTVRVRYVKEQTRFCDWVDPAFDQYGDEVP